MADIIPITPPKATTSVTLSVTLPADTAALVQEFISHNQHSNNSHGPMTLETLVRLWLEDVSAAVRDADTWQGAHAALVLSCHGYKTGE
jgi:hypothetical protein